MLAAVGDLIDDIVVTLGGPIQVASDTAALVDRRRGGSAANVAVVAARLTGSSRFLGQVGDDDRGEWLVNELAADGVDVSAVRRRGRTGAIVVLVDAAGERSFLTDAGTARDLDDPRPGWLDGVDVLHVPLYSLTDGVLAVTARTLIGWARERSTAVSIDLSSRALIEALGVPELGRMLDQLAPDAVFANTDEAGAAGIDAAVAGALTFVKAGAGSVTVHTPTGAALSVPAIALDQVVDTTGAGDAFAAGVLTHPGWHHDIEAACTAGHSAAASVLAPRAAG